MRLYSSFLLKFFSKPFIIDLYIHFWLPHQSNQLIVFSLASFFGCLIFSFFTCLNKDKLICSFWALSLLLFRPQLDKYSLSLTNRLKWNKHVGKCSFQKRMGGRKEGVFKVQLFWEGHKNVCNGPHGFDVY